MEYFLIVIYCVFCYILGWFLSGYFVVRFLGHMDIRQEGSENPGALNAGRVLGAKGFILTLLGDGGKGAAVVAFGFQLGFSQEVVLLGLTAAVAGHIWPLPFKFRGGKGAATFLGGLLIYHSPSLLFLLAVTALGRLFWREFTACGLLAVLIWPIFFCFGNGQGERGLMLTALSGVLTAIILLAHRQNIRGYYEKYYRKKDLQKNASGVRDKNGHYL
ncbi:MAG TPA: glycerol-3-phosphate acyltransferase [Peptococcaceae bacterium]|nr:glycerol-3-phosphate acyltransferase [Peptococcaceae bacterium]